MSNYKLELFEKALKAEQQLEQAQTKKEQKEAQRIFGCIADTLFFSGWRDEYDTWCQHLRD